jgi:pimeloyl-ACP methyl ester carboxylesterase
VEGLTGECSYPRLALTAVAAMRHERAMHFTSADGVQLYYELHGSAGEPLVFVHGYTGDITDWRHQIPEFARTHRMLVLDNRGHGRSQAPADPEAFSVERMADDVEALAAQVGFERFHLLGHSMGGAIAQEIALRSPEKLLSLILEDTSCLFAGHRIEVPETPRPLPPERQQQVLERMSGMTPETLLACWQALMRWPGTEQHASRIQARTLIIYGTHDAPALIAGSRRLGELIPGSELRAIADTAHCPQEERPVEFNAALREFLERGSR